MDGVATTNCPRDEFVKLVNNGRNAVRFTLKEAHDPLGEFVKQWGKEKTVTLNLKEGNNFKDEFKLAHFYSKVCCVLCCNVMNTLENNDFNS